jgi:NAD(P)H dehydrogenase (quinone)
METTVLDLVHALLVHGMIVKGESGGAHFGAVAVGAPDDAAIQACERLGKSVATLAQKLVG